ncbi:MAG: sigma-70 family RNA polymerase sigma factor [Planctomycetes bacterium]|nr:sigma-70 family RNA polymerase sigma factor [Planctomycetota bacterium]
MSSTNPRADLDVTLLLDRMAAGDGQAADRLVPFLYRELRRLAVRRMGRESDTHTLDATALVHEAWLRLGERTGSYRNRAHFFGAAALAMRAILVDHARRVRSIKAGGRRRRLSLSQVELSQEERTLDALSLGEALERLEAVAPDKATVATMRFLFGCSVEETAEALACSAAKIKKDWAFARAWLKRELER